MVKLETGDTFSFPTWTSSNGLKYKLNAQNGVLTSTTGNIYGN
jgi:cyanophycinase